MPKALAKRLKEAASEREVSTSYLINKALEHYLDSPLHTGDQDDTDG